MAIKKATKSDKKDIVPRGRYILVKPDEQESRTSYNGIILPSNIEQEQKALGTVIAFGPDVSGVDKGDKVIYGVYAGESIKQKDGAKDVEYKLLHDDDVIAFLR